MRATQPLVIIPISLFLLFRGAISTFVRLAETEKLANVRNGAPVERLSEIPGSTTISKDPHSVVNNEDVVYGIPYYHQPSPYELRAWVLSQSRICAPRLLIELKGYLLELENPARDTAQNM
ncbi:hypothetical protein BY996DRAFT_6423245 [Phakopsora pachyrhizi]|nr:hypothetical protein BY996DRAFT_6423245 [Phakopsora pachyrhizi]